MKPRWPRFSLRTLIVVVLAVGLCWTLTATWGVNSIITSSPHNKEWRGSVLHVERIDDDGSRYVWDLKATAILPFIVRNHERGQMPSGLQYEDTRTWFWFFG